MSADRVVETVQNIMGYRPLFLAAFGDGRFKTLGEVLDFYSKGALPNPHLDTRITAFDMDKQTKEDLLAFLTALNGEGWQNIRAPERMPQ